MGMLNRFARSFFFSSSARRSSCAQHRPLSSPVPSEQTKSSCQAVNIYTLKYLVCRIVYTEEAARLGKHGLADARLRLVCLCAAGLPILGGRGRSRLARLGRCLVARRLVGAAEPDRRVGKLSSSLTYFASAGPK